MSLVSEYNQQLPLSSNRLNRGCHEHRLVLSPIEFPMTCQLERVGSFASIVVISHIRGLSQYFSTVDIILKLLSRKLSIVLSG